MQYSKKRIGSFVELSIEYSDEDVFPANQLLAYFDQHQAVRTYRLKPESKSLSFQCLAKDEDLIMSHIFALTVVQNKLLILSPLLSFAASILFIASLGVWALGMEGAPELFVLGALSGSIGFFIKPPQWQTMPYARASHIETVPLATLAAEVSETELSRTCS